VDFYFKLSAQSVFFLQKRKLEFKIERELDSFFPFNEIHPTRSFSITTF
jgi:hypothetical protein